MRLAARLALALTCAGVLLTTSCSAAAAAAAAGPGWDITMAAIPSVLPAGPEHHGEVEIVAENVGSAPSPQGAVLRVALPAGFKATSADGPCEGLESEALTCTFTEPVAPRGFVFLTLSFSEPGSLPPGSDLQLVAHVIGAQASDTTTATIAVQRSGEHGPGPAGIAHFEARVTGPSGEPFTQAGGHPTVLTTSMIVNTMYDEQISGPVRPVEPIKDLVIYLPLGLLGNPTVAAECPLSLVQTSFDSSGCPLGSQVGEIVPLILSGSPLAYNVYNITPERGYAAEVAFSVSGIPAVAYGNVVRRDGTYALRLAIPGVPVSSSMIGVVGTFFGDIQEQFQTEGNEVTFDRGAFLTDPTNCDEPATALQAELALNTWEQPSLALPLRATSLAFPSISGCDVLNFAASLNVRPETTQAASPSGYQIAMQLPQAPDGFSGVANPPVKEATITLPLGTTISTSAANGLGSCPATGPHAINIEGPESEEIAADGLPRPAAGNCPPASAIASVRASSPLLNEEMAGSAYLATPECGSGEQGCTPEDAEDGKLFPLYIELQAPNRGVIVKLRGRALIRPGTGAVSVVIDELPEFPLSSFVATTKSAARAPFQNAQACGRQTASAIMVPWDAGMAPVEPTSNFETSWNGEGEPCPSRAPFAPGFSAGTTTPLAGSTSPFTLTLTREDREQDIRSLTATLPDGLLADVATATQCPEPIAAEASLTACPTASRIGKVTIAVGAGSEPYYVTGSVFLTGPYAGAPFGLSAVVPAIAGPFNLGNVHVRIRLYIDPRTANATAVSDPFPEELDGIPVRIRILNLAIDDENFVLNPTSCSRMQINATAISVQGATAPQSSPFAVKGCRNLPFKPTVSGSTEARSTKADGTGVTMRIAYPSSGQANIEKIILGFPKQLPVRLATLQGACRVAIFDANPAQCPPSSSIGTAVAHTPILSKPLIGPIYLISYGSAKFPAVVLVLQGEGITIDVEGQSFVSRAGVLTVSFAAVPDAPFSSVEAMLPSGPDSQFTSRRSITRPAASQCGERLQAPVSLRAHDGAELNERVTIRVLSCPRRNLRVHARRAGDAVAVTADLADPARLTITGKAIHDVRARTIPAGSHTVRVRLTATAAADRRPHVIPITVDLRWRGKHVVKRLRVHV